MEAKKMPSADLQKRSTFFFSLGLMLSLMAVIAAFNWKFYDEGPQINLRETSINDVELIDVPITNQPLPPPPKIQQPQIVEVPNEEIVEEEIDINLDVQISEEMVVAEVLQPIIKKEEAPEEEVADEIFQVVENQPEPKGGYINFYSFVSENLKYPSRALNNRTEGRVFVQFVVDKDGSLSDIVIIKGIGDGCDEEAIRVLSSAPKWNPGKQRGKNVRVRMVIPITFKLANDV